LPGKVLAMRNPRFRIWNKMIKQWEVKGFHLIGEVMLLQGFPIERLNELEVNQSTELKDKNGVEIYEGDVVRFKAWKGKHQGAVKWNDGTCGYEIEMSPTSHTGFYHDPLRTYEVIGDIYQNPELLSPEGSK
jgi:uncharacterized phage protein (TIGR01671 family)